MKYGIIVNVQKDPLAALLQEFLGVLIRNDCDFIINSESAAVLPAGLVAAHQFHPSEEIVVKAGVLVSFGGDGTLLSVARLVGRLEKPILGVNIGKLGFLTEVELAELEAAIHRIRLGKYEIEERMVLEARWNGATAYALNDFVIVKSEAGRVIRVSAHVDHYFLNTYTADGLIVSTPTGSTAYSLSANGPIIHPTMDAVILNPICPHTLMVRPLVISSDQEVQLNLARGFRAILTADGHDEGELDDRTDVIIRKAAHKIHLMRLGERTYFEVLRSKLHWGEDPRNEKTGAYPGTTGPWEP